MCSVFATWTSEEIEEVVVEIAADNRPSALGELFLTYLDRPFPDGLTSGSWTSELRNLAIDEVFLLEHVLGDRRLFILPVRIPTKIPLLVGVEVDDDLGSLVVDAFLVPGDAGELAVAIPTTRPEMRPADCSPAQARAELEDALECGTSPLMVRDADRWPTCEPMVRWLLRCLPAGGSPRSCDFAEAHDVLGAIDAFFTTDWGRALDRPNRRAQLTKVLTDLADEGEDPLRWSPLSADRRLDDWSIDRWQPVDDLDVLLCAFVGHRHSLLDVPPDLTSMTMDVIRCCIDDRWPDDIFKDDH
jgi:hypothetical protein